MYTNVLLERDTKKEIKRFVGKLSKSIDDLLLGRLSITYGKDIVPLAPVDIIRAVSEISIESSAELSVRNMFLSSIIESETRCKFSGFVSALTACYATKNMLRLKSMNADYMNSHIQNDMSRLSHNSHEVSFLEAMSVIKKLTRDELTHRILQETLSMAGASGKVLVDLTPNDETFISSFVGYKFSVSPHHLFSSSGCDLQHWNRRNVLCIIIDGIVEKMSEIERIVQHLSKDKISSIMFARGYGDEVVSTLSVNFLRNTLNVVPVIVPFDETGINMLNDIAVVAGGDVISSLKGELISQKTKDDMLMIDEVRIKNGEVVLFHDRTRESVHKHVVRLKKAVHTQVNSFGAPEDDKKKMLLEKRISSLTGEGVQIKVGMSLGQKRGIVLDRIQSGLGIFKNMCRFGSVDIENYQSISDVISTPIQRLRKIGHHMPTTALLSGLQSGIQLAESMTNLSVIVSYDN